MRVWVRSQHVAPWCGRGGFVAAWAGADGLLGRHWPLLLLSQRGCVAWLLLLLFAGALGVEDGIVGA